jgi:S-formylglutathione hydrolase FrmB
MHNSEPSGSAMSLTHGWIPLTAQLIASAVALLAIAGRSRRWFVACVPLAVFVGVGLAAAMHWYVRDQGLADDPVPWTLWAWITMTGLAAAVVVLGWRNSAWWRRSVSVLAVPLCVVCTALTLNAWVGYLPTASLAWDRMTGAPLPGQTDPATVAALRHQGAALNWKAVVKVTIPNGASGFKHRDELVLLPPAWYASTPPPRLPVVMMIGGEFGQPAAWLSAGNAQKTFDDFAAAHGGNAPVLVFPDYSGAFSNDTECVNGPRGNAADHLTKDVVPYLISNFRVSADPANWGVVGWSSGGTCALTLSVMHPELFGAFVDIDGQRGPNAGTKQQTIARLFGGDADAWAAFDPRSVIAKHGLYSGMSAWFSVSDDTPTVYRAAANTGQLFAAGNPGASATSEDHAAIANELCQLASGHGIECAVVPSPGNHDFASAASGFATSLPWLAGKLQTPAVPEIALPGAPSRP